MSLGSRKKIISVTAVLTICSLFRPETLFIGPLRGVSEDRGCDVAISQKSDDFLLNSRLADAEAGDVDALFELGVTYSTGRGQVAVDLIEAHKWFNLAALSGDTRSQACRADFSFEMTAREIAEAQRAARAWLGMTAQHRHAA